MSNPEGGRMFQPLPTHLVETFFIQHLEWEDMITLQCLNSKFRQHIQSNERFWLLWCLDCDKSLAELVQLSENGVLAHDLDWRLFAMMQQNGHQKRVQLEICLALVNERLERPMSKPGAFRLQCQVHHKLGVHILPRVSFAISGRNGSVVIFFSSADGANVLIYHGAKVSIKFKRIDRRLPGNQQNLKEEWYRLYWTRGFGQEMLLSKSDYEVLGRVLHNQANYFNGERIVQHNGTFASTGRIGQTMSTRFGSSSTVVERPLVDAKSYKHVCVSFGYIDEDKDDDAISFFKRLLYGHVKMVEEEEEES